MEVMIRFLPFFGRLTMPWTRFISPDTLFPSFFSSLPPPFSSSFGNMVFIIEFFHLFFNLSSLQARATMCAQRDPHALIRRFHFAQCFMVTLVWGCHLQIWHHPYVDGKEQLGTTCQACQQPNVSYRRMNEWHVSHCIFSYITSWWPPTCGC